MFGEPERHLFGCVQFRPELDVVSVGTVNRAVAAAGVEGDERRTARAERPPELARDRRQRRRGRVDDRIPGEDTVRSRVRLGQVP